MKQLFCKSLEQWRDWLHAHHHQKEGVWLVFHRKGVPGQSLDYEHCLEEALCFGRIDSLIKKIDDTCFVRKFTPRTANSKWSPANKKRVDRLIEDGRMQEAGFTVIETAKANGSWEKPDRPSSLPEIPRQWQAALNLNGKAMETYRRLAPTLQRRYDLWIAAAKRPETRENRIREALKLLETGQKLPLK